MIQVEELAKTYRQGFWMKKVEAVRGISFQVDQGDVFGFLGPNGAGKTTTIKMLTGLISPSAGSARLFGLPVQQVAARKRLGFLPENPYVYPYLTPREFVHMCGRLSGLRSAAARSRTRDVLARVGIAYAADRPVRALSKGMLQRAGLAAALVADPELLILDEPMSGLDPVGRKEVRDLILRERDAGRTIFLSSHILSDVEAMCERVAILRQGRVVVTGKLRDLLRSDVKRVEVVVADSDGRLTSFLAELGLAGRRKEGRLSVEVEGESTVQSLLREAVRCGLSVLEVVPKHETLENLFVREAIGGQSEPDGVKAGESASD